MAYYHDLPIEAWQPIEVVALSDGTFLIANGNHRACVALRRGLSHIRACVVTLGQAHTRRRN